MKIEFAFSYAKLKPKEREVIEFLYGYPRKTFEGGYSDLVKAMNLPVYENVSNYRKTILNLTKMRIVEINIPKFIKLTADWKERIK